MDRSWGDYPSSVAYDLREWTERVAENFATARIAQVDSGFYGSIQAAELDGIGLSRAQFSSHVLERTARHIEANERPRYVLCLQLAGGRSVVVQDGREAFLAPGDMTIYDTSHPYTLVHEDGVDCIGVVIPEKRVTLSRQMLRSLTAMRMPGDDQLTATSLQAVEGFHKCVEGLAVSARHRLASTVVNMFETLCVNSAMRLQGLEVDPRSKLREAVMQFIAEHLSDPELTPQRIAEAHFISLRSLHSLAQESGATVSGWIRNMRLERCKSNIEDPTLHDLSLAEIGARWGFAHHSHFTTLFRNYFGFTPGAHRNTSTR